MSTSAAPAATPNSSVRFGFEEIYRAQVGAVTAFFARRCAEPQAVADLTADTFVRAIVSLASFDARKGSARVWLFGIARRVYARHCAEMAGSHEAARRVAGRRELGDDEHDELVAKIDAQRAGRS